MRNVLSVLILTILLLPPVALAQDPLGGGLFSSYTSKVRNGTSDPAACQPTGMNVFINRTGTPVLKICTAANTWTAVGAGVGGSTGATDNAILRADGAGGSTVQTSAVTINDSGGVVPVTTASQSLGSGSSTWLSLALSDTGGVSFFNTDTGNINRLRWTDGVGPFWTDGGSGFNLTHNVQLLTANRAVTWPDLAGTVVVGSAVASTVGAAGAASALPATPLGYLTVKLPDGTSVKIPYYNP